MKIRRASAEDAVALAAFGARTFEETFGPDNKPEDIAAYLADTYSPELQRRELESPNMITLVAEIEGEIAAYAQLKSGALQIEIGRFYVDRAHHGTGIAQALMREAIATAESENAERIWLAVWEKNARAIAFYAKCGFRDTGSKPFLLGSDLQTDRIMERSL